MDKVLIVDDDIAISESLRFGLRKEYELFFAVNTKEALDIYNQEQISSVILDLRLNNEDGMDVYRQIREINPQAVVIIITAHGTIESSVEAIKSGVFQYLTKPIDLEELKFTLSRAVEMDKLHRRVKDIEDDRLNELKNQGIIAYSDKMKSILQTVDKVKDIDSIILITGESGTGKSMVAKFIHRLGHRSANPFYSINCAAIPQNLLESELFGYKKGAFTGANTDKKGYFQLADKGTLFLDEIGDLDLKLQGKLLQAIQEKRVTPLGAEQSEAIDVRIITATNKDFDKLLKEGKFRMDLYYRLNVINITMPPLRERREDIPYLTRHFIDKYSMLLGKSINKVSDDFLELISRMELKGNIRELENIIERAIALSENETLEAKDIVRTPTTVSSNLGIKGELIPVFIGESLEEVEKKLIMATMKKFENQSQAARVLGITDRTIRNKLKKYKE
ncbi:MAG: sigma-54 dependent transcriptional regulator [Tissierellia bacterium]|nr:sigma-54 dependent transcriptional regulator [Tissierellia bacterium]